MKIEQGKPCLCGKHKLLNMLGSSYRLDCGSCAHRQLVHMDIKSANVLLQDKTCRVAKIADMGVARYLVEGSLLDYTYRGAVHKALSLFYRKSSHHRFDPIYFMQTGRTAGIFFSDL